MIPCSFFTGHSVCTDEAVRAAFWVSVADMLDSLLRAQNRVLAEALQPFYSWELVNRVDVASQN